MRTDMEATWGHTRTGNVFHSFGAEHATCRKNIKRPEGTLRTEESVDKSLAKGWGISTLGFRKCERCAQLEADFRNRLEASMSPSTGEGDYLPPAEDRSGCTCPPSYAANDSHDDRCPQAPKIENCCDHASMYHGARGCDECHCTVPRYLMAAHQGATTGEQRTVKTTRKPQVLDLFCGAGGATQGYLSVGWAVHGVDIEPQPDYQYEFTQADVLDLTVEYIRQFDFVHASPPCQRDSAITLGTNKHLRHTYPNLYGPTKALLEAAGVPYVIENPAARPDVVLCGEMFGLRVIRHRNFELGGWTARQPVEPEHRGLILGMRHGKLITQDNGGYYYAVYGNGGYKGTVAEWQDAMGIHWTNKRKSIAEAIPPAYTRYVGTEFMRRNT